MPQMQVQNCSLLSIALLAISSSAFANVSPVMSANTQHIDTHILKLNSDSAKCQLIVETENKTSQLSLSLNSPCYWISKPDSTSAQYYSYPSENISYMLLVAGTELDWDDAEKKYQKLPTDTYCSQYIQGIAVKEGTIKLSGEKMDAPNCVGQAVDEKVFHGAALRQNKAPNETTETETMDEEKGLFDSIKKTFKQLFNSEDN